MKLKQIATLGLVSVIAVSCTFAFSSCSKTHETTEITSDVTQVADADDTVIEPITETVKSNIIIVTDENKNQLSLIPIMDVTGKTMIAGYVKSAVDKDNKEITDNAIVGKCVAISTDANGIHSITLKDNKTLFLNFFADDNNLIIALQSATDGKYYEVTSVKGDDDNISMKLTADKNGKAIEVEIKKNGDETSVVEKSSGKTVAKKKKKKNTTTTTTTTADQTVPDKVVTVTDYSSLADINVILTKNSTASVGLASDSPVKVNVSDKAYVKGGVLYLQGNGDYYITQSKDSDTWWGKIVINLGNKGLARVRMAGVTITSKESSAIEFIDTDTVINDTDADSEVLIKYNNTSTSKNNPDAVLSFVDGTTNNLVAQGNSAKGAGTIYSECKLSIQGHGTANVTAKNKNGIHAVRSVGIQNVTLNVKSEAAKGIRVYNLLDVEENAKITVNSLGDALRCGEFLMDVDKDEKGNKDLSTGSTVTLRPDSGGASATTGDGIDADDNVIVRAGTLDIYVKCKKAKYGVKVRRVNNEEFIKIIKSENITDIAKWKESNKESPYYTDVVLNEKEYGALVAVANVSTSSAEYQGIRTSSGCDDTFRITGGTVKSCVVFGRNSSVINSTNSQKSINVTLPTYTASGETANSRSIKINNYISSGETDLFAILFSSKDVKTGDTVTFGQASKRQPEHTVTVKFNGNIGTAQPSN